MRTLLRLVICLVCASTAQAINDKHFGSIIHPNFARVTIALLNNPPILSRAAISCRA